MVTIVQRLSRPWVRAVTTGIVGAAIVTAIFVLASGQVSERVFLIVAGLVPAERSRTIMTSGLGIAVLTAPPSRGNCFSASYSATSGEPSPGP